MKSQVCTVSRTESDVQIIIITIIIIIMKAMLIGLDSIETNRKKIVTKTFRLCRSVITNVNSGANRRLNCVRNIAHSVKTKQKLMIRFFFIFIFIASF